MLNLQTDEEDLVINGTLLIPKLSRNLISVQHLNKIGINAECRNGECYIKKNNKTIITSKLENKLYNIHFHENKESAYSTNEENIQLWHHRMGHLNMQDLTSITELNLNNQN